MEPSLDRFKGRNKISEPPTKLKFESLGSERLERQFCQIEDFRLLAGRKKERAQGGELDSG